MRYALGALADSEVPAFDAEEELSILVKVHPPVHIRVVPPPSMIATAAPSIPTTGSRTTSELVESFMSAWSRLVGDPLLSKWIVVVLAMSISLNGYLLKAIGAGLAGKGHTVKSGGVRFNSEDSEGKTAVTHEMAVPIVARAVVERPTPRPVKPATFTLDDVDKKLARVKPTKLHLMSPPSSTESSASDDEESIAADFVRPLEECINVFENGPKPVSVSLAMLNDEEVILLAQNGKIAAYALEKVLGPDELERAVRIRRALICEDFLFP